MHALQTMTVPREYLDPPISTTSHSSPQKPPLTFDAISNQLLSLTNIASGLQKEMAQLSRRSKDNATDLVSLKEATNSRDEDIRKCLRELVNTVNQPPPVQVPGDMSRPTSSLNLKDPHMTPTKQFTLPRMSSPGGFFMDERIGSPNPYSVEGAASVAMLEKIIREMVTKDGQERLIANLQTLVDKATGDTAKKVTELVEFIKEGSQNQPIVPPAVSGSASFQPSPGSGPLTRANRDLNNPNFPVPKGSDGIPYSSPKAADFVSDQMLNLLRKIKDSVAEAGEQAAETKSLTSQLREGVLEMGKDLAKKLDDLSVAQSGSSALVSEDDQPDISSIIQESMTELRQHITEVMRERRRQSNSSTITRATIDNQEVSDVVRHVLTECGLNQLTAPGAVSLDKEEILVAVKEAYDAYKPHVEVQQYGLEREEILQCLREGLKDYQESGGISREEVMSTIQNSLQQLTLPSPVNEAHEIREEVLSAVRESLEEIKPSLVPAAPPSEGITKEDLLEAMREILSNRDASYEINIDPEGVSQAVERALQSSRPADAGGDEVLERLQALVSDMHSEFKEYSAASGRDNEQVLDALKDGLESLRTEIESYVDKTQDVTQKNEIMEAMHAGLQQLRDDVQGFVAEGPLGDKALSQPDLYQFIKSEFELLDEKLSSRFRPAAEDKEEIINAINLGFEGMKSQVATRDLDLDTNEEINEAMKAEFEQLKEDLLTGNAGHKEEILEKLQTSLDELHSKFGSSLTVPNSNDDILRELKDEFEHLRTTLTSSLVQPARTADKDEIIDSVRELLDGLRSHLSATQETASKENVDVIRGELENLRETLGSSLVPSPENVDNNEILETLRAGLDEIQANCKSLGLNEELLEAFRGELEQIRQSNGVTRQHARADTDEVLETVRLGLDDLRSHLEKKIDNPERQMSATAEIIDAVNDGLETLRADVAKVAEKPVDMTVSYEILDALKDGISSLREDIQRLKGKENPVHDEEERSVPSGNEIVLAEDPEKIATRDFAQDIAQDIAQAVPEDSLRRNDLEKMELMLAQIQVKVDTMDANIQHPAPGSEISLPSESVVMKEDLVGIEELLKELQTTIGSLGEREHQSLEALAKKEDTDALETLLDNVKAKVEDMVLLLPDPEVAVTKEHLDQVETAVRTANEAIEALSAKIDENGATKGDVAVVEVLVSDMKTALDEMKAAKPEEDEAEKLTKTDLDTLALFVTEIKEKVDTMRIPEPEELPSKADVEQLTGLIHDFRENHDKLFDLYNNDIAVTAKRFEERRAEADGLLQSVTEVKTVLDDFKEEIKTNLVEGNQGVQDLKESLQKSLEDTAGSNLLLSADLKEFVETVASEFEKAHGSLEGLKSGLDEQSATTVQKHDETKEAVIASLCEKIDDRFNVLMAKYDDAQLLADEQARVMKEKAEEQEQVLAATKTMAEELKLSIDTLGATITGMDSRVDEATQKWTSDSETVSGRIEETITKLDEHHADGKSEHQHTREDIANALRALNDLQDNVTEYHPKFMVTLREILALVNQHYEHSQKAKEASEEQVKAIAQDTRARAEEIQSVLFTKLPALLPPPLPPVEPVEQYDDSRLQEKLDKLLHHADDAKNSAEQLKRLDEIHKQVMTTATEVSEFVSKQTQMITDGHESKEREAEEVALLLERRLTQKEQLETDIQGLKEEKDALLATVAALQAERENLANQKVRLTGEVSSLHTALEIRREELHAMDAKADALERRILNGIMDHSRALMIAKGSKSPPKAKTRKSGEGLDDTKLMPPQSAAANGLSMALKPRPAIRRNGPPPNPAGRRILSLSQITSNVPTGAQAYSYSTGGTNGSNNLKRSHSVKTNYLRKGSWAGRPTLAESNKENETLSEESESELESPQETTTESQHDPEHEEEVEDDLQSNAGTELRHEVEGSYAESFSGRSSYGTGSEYTYASGSYMSGSDVDRRTSYGSTARSMYNGTETIDEGGDESQSGSESGSEDEDIDNTVTVHIPPSPSEVEAPGEGALVVAVPVEAEKKPDIHVVTLGLPSDSGVGTDLETAGLEHTSNADYFRRAAEEESTVG
ncbi:hypothetical protein GQ43DRAFT_440723 [Delitschia confertaspora ATCC 74209]|uniref:Chromosome segregation ATPase family protein n=1 Tax=Delitschia confertaspora ATCC 74209 TaxID=1513339 RepID=A0A9P4JKS2_9PLEO|nr:hypothetical protein GQ43DRAFT_440723 [Delitschia confertaspora ATCC 74209]